ncbi:45 kDa calcium-binding protein-like isoform X2 [Ischnura elegans]|uniref:45 kDa calcium-binding protein-like isoform X2 n=1 Tax=Ischnura elegans TaxID=197161 RepID=UPI001ED8803B|nr:45 kDa calcium-binding protein-like isoform X2 [Ischnura elegans]
MKTASSVLSFRKEYRCRSGTVLAAAAPFLLYVCFFTLVRNFSLPLRSDGVGKIPPARRENDEDKNGMESNARDEGDADGYIPQGIQPDVEGEEKDPKITLEDVFSRADTDGDGLLSVAELTEWIGGKIKDHLDHALKENFGLFAAIDNNPRNEAIARDRASWSEAAHSDPDALTLDEFLAFRHPESSHATILALVDEMLEKFDRDGDGQLTETEYSRFVWDEGAEEEAIEDRNRREGEVQREEERRKEFREQVDADKSGHADRRELLKYIDPSNPRHAREEAETLMVLSDADHDGHLSLREVLNKMDLFLGSKMVDAARSFHDEF